VFFINYLKTSKLKKMSFKKLAGDILIVSAGVAVYMLAIKPLLDKANLGK
jgi:hypothetical protein